MERVTFQNKGNTVVGDLFQPDGAEQGTRYPAIVATHPFGAVKEQVPATYAKLLPAATASAARSRRSTAPACSSGRAGPARARRRAVRSRCSP
jgi:fermentation-respiration switch protein FrsA (DUF1100 family)